MNRRIFAKSAIAACAAVILRPVLDASGASPNLTWFRRALIVLAVISVSFEIGYGAAVLTAPRAQACVTNDC